MNKKSLALIGFATIIIVAAAFLHAATPKDQGVGKFHLVYLVSTDKVEVGAKAYVEPLFFTDGKRLVFAYDYCRQQYLRNRNEPEAKYGYTKDSLLYKAQIGMGTTEINSYCANKRTVVNLSNYFVRTSSNSARPSFGPVEFVPFKSNEQYWSPLLPQSGLSAIQHVDVVSTNNRDTIVDNSTLQKNFLVSASRSSLDLISPSISVSPSEKTVIYHRINSYIAKRLNSSNREANFTECKLTHGLHSSAPVMQGPHTLDKASIDTVLIADIDNDGKLDAIVSLRESFKQNISGINVDTIEIRIFRGNGTERCLIWDYGIVGRFIQSQNIKIPRAQPISVLSISGKPYLLLTSFGTSLSDSIYLSLSESIDIVPITDGPKMTVRKYHPIL